MPECCKCSDSGWIIEHDQARPCVCRRSRIRESKLRRIDLRFRQSSFVNFDPKSERQAEIKKRMSSFPQHGYFISGRYGSGKTHLLVSQYKTLLDGTVCELRSAREISEEFRRAEMGEFSVIIERARNMDNFHLFWDDIDKMRRTDFRDEMIFDLVDTLYRREQGLSITSNATLDQLEEQELLPPGVVRRIREMCESVVL